MVDRAFGATLRNFGTLFLMVAVLTVPLHLAYSIMFRNVIETRELHPVIETFPDSRQVRSVGRTQLTQARVGLGVLTLIELAAIPFLARGARKVLRDADAGELPSVAEALRSVREGPKVGFDTRGLGPVLVSAVVALAIGLLFERAGLLLIEFVPDERSYPFFGLMQGVSRALGAPFLLVMLVHAGRARTARPEVTPSLY